MKKQLTVEIVPPGRGSFKVVVDEVDRTWVKR